jgi:hypothetical protein
VTTTTVHVEMIGTTRSAAALGKYLEAEGLAWSYTADGLEKRGGVDPLQAMRIVFEIAGDATIARVDVAEWLEPPANASR